MEHECADLSARIRLKGYFAAGPAELETVPGYTIQADDRPVVRNLQIQPVPVGGDGSNDRWPQRIGADQLQEGYRGGSTRGRGPLGKNPWFAKNGGECSQGQHDASSARTIVQFHSNPGPTGLRQHLICQMLPGRDQPWSLSSRQDDGKPDKFPLIGSQASWKSQRLQLALFGMEVAARTSAVPTAIDVSAPS